MGKCNYASVTQILADCGLTKGSPYFLEKHRMRGKAVHAATCIIGRGGTIDPSWWQRSSGNPDFPDSYFKHEECRPHVDAYAAWQAKSSWHPVKFEYEVKSLVGPYIGHIDEIGYFDHKPDDWWLIDKKNGGPELWHRLQTAGYKYALAIQDQQFVRRGCLYLPSGKLVEHTNETDSHKFHVLVQYFNLCRDFQ